MPSVGCDRIRLPVLLNKALRQQSIVPSGHASEAFTVATAIAENYPLWWVQILCYDGIGLVGHARIEQNAHYASDFVAGSLLRLGGRPCRGASPQRSAQSQQSPRVFQVVLIGTDRGLHGLASGEGAARAWY
jgi:hypothetical protein